MGKCTCRDSTREKELPTEGGKVAVSQKRSQAGASDVNAELQEDAAAQHLRLC